MIVCKRRTAVIARKKEKKKERKKERKRERK